MSDDGPEVEAAEGGDDDTEDDGYEFIDRNMASFLQPAGTCHRVKGARALVKSRKQSKCNVKSSKQ